MFDRNIIVASVPVAWDPPVKTSGVQVQPSHAQTADVRCCFRKHDRTITIHEGGNELQSPDRKTSDLPLRPDRNGGRLCKEMVQQQALNQPPPMIKAGL